MTDTPKFDFMPASVTPSMCKIMASTTSPAERARAIERYLDEMIIGGQFDRLNQTQRCELRGLVFGLNALAEDLDEPKMSKRGWWRIWR